MPGAKCADRRRRITADRIPRPRRQGLVVRCRHSIQRAAASYAVAAVSLNAMAASRACRRIRLITCSRSSMLVRVPQATAHGDALPRMGCSASAQPSPRRHFRPLIPSPAPSTTMTRIYPNTFPTDRTRHYSQTEDQQNRGGAGIRPGHRRDHPRLHTPGQAPAHSPQPRAQQPPARPATFPAFVAARRRYRPGFLQPSGRASLLRPSRRQLMTAR